MAAGRTCVGRAIPALWPSNSDPNSTRRHSQWVPWTIFHDFCVWIVSNHENASWRIQRDARFSSLESGLQGL